ncbi:cytochrome c oxidase subunit I [Haloarchaeobius amylolyticus]|uniref:cytochrome c oxidase subunit I n=1 Tax=Haloarchaeobius amylolyticus TaxID=1198296 RepID=UPI00226D4B35|nr:cbb3-type cytochrome c oxidase subunit I [Haloarchaeobius amylolyticus]
MTGPVDPGSGPGPGPGDRGAGARPSRRRLVHALFTGVDHLTVGRRFVVFGVLFGFLGALDALMLRFSLLTPTATLWSRGTYDALFTTHGITMLFLAATPVLLGLASALLPPLLDAEEVAFPRVNALACWLLVPAAVLVRAGLVADLVGLAGVRPAAVGWTLYAPMSVAASNPAVDALLVGLHLTGIAATLSAVVLLVTVVTERGPGVGWDDVDAFGWSVLTTAAMILFAYPVLESALVMLLADRTVGTTFFLGDGGGALLWQHLFWFFGHPEVYILVLPPMGIISRVLPAFAGRRLHGEAAMVYSTVAIGVLGFAVWGHHMFTTGMDPRVQASFMALTLVIAVPSAVKTLDWLLTLRGAALRLTAPALFCLAAVANLVLGGVTGVLLAATPLDRVYHGTYYVVGHFHLLLVGTSAFATLGGCYYWFPLLTGRLYDRTLARVHFWLTAVGTLGTFLPMLALGLGGLPRRFATYPIEFLPLQAVSTVFALVLGGAQLLWLYNVLASWWAGPRVTTGDVWDVVDTPAPSREWEWLDHRLAPGSTTDAAASEVSN